MPVSSEDVRKAFGIEVAALGVDADDDLLDYVSSIASDILTDAGRTSRLENHQTLNHAVSLAGGDPQDLQDIFSESVAPYLASFLDDQQSETVVKSVLLRLTDDAPGAPGAPANPQASTPMPPPPTTEIADKQQAETKVPYQPKWATSTAQGDGTGASGNASAARQRDGEDQAPSDPGAGAETKTSDVDLCDTLFSMAYGGRTLLQVRFLSPTSS